MTKDLIHISEIDVSPFLAIVEVLLYIKVLSTISGKPNDTDALAKFSLIY